MKSQNLNNLWIKQCKIRRLLCAGLAFSCLAMLNANANPPYDIAVHPASQTGAIFGSATFTVTAESGSPLTYQWLFDGTAIANATNSALMLGPLGFSESGPYSVLVSNMSGVATSSIATLNIPEALVSNSGVGNQSNLQNALLQFTNLTSVSANSGTVYCFESNGTVATISNAPPYDGPYFSFSLTNVIAVSLGNEGYDLALESNGTVMGRNFNSPYQTNIPVGLSNVTAVAAGDNYGLALRSDGTVVGWPMTVASNGTFQVEVSNAVAITAGLILKANGTVAQLEFGVPTSQVLVVPGVTNIIAIAAAYNYFIGLTTNGTVVEWSGSVTDPLPGVSNIVAIAADNEGFLGLQADGTLVGTSTLLNQFGGTLSNVFAIDINESYNQSIVLFNHGAPVFTVQPANQIQTNGGAVWLHARAVGTQPMSYQWLLNGASIPDATNADLTITNAQENNSGQYSVLVSNQVGTATSMVASVTIPFVHVPANLGIPIIMPGGFLLFNVYATNGSILTLSDPSNVVFETSSDLVNWTPLTNAVTLTNGAALLYDPNSTNSPVRFYRLLRE